MSLLKSSSPNTHWWSHVVMSTRWDFPLVPKLLSSQSDWNTGVCSAEWVLASARLICVAGIDNFGEQPLCWTRLKSTIAHKQFDQNRVQQSVCSRVLANIPKTRKQFLASTRFNLWNTPQTNTHWGSCFVTPEWTWI